MGMAQYSYLSLGPTGFHRVAYTDWGDPAASHIVICVHGLTRNSRDFDFLARSLESQCRVVCMDVVGRGDSEWLDDKAGYTFATYTNDAAALIARVTTPPRGSFFSELQRQWRLRVGNGVPERRIDWVGTSMGGLIGLLLAAKPGSPIRRLVLNDVGPLIPWSALLRLSRHALHGTAFADRDVAEAQLRNACAPFGLDSEAQWEHLLRHSIATADDGSVMLRYDPALGTLSGPGLEFPLGPQFMRGVELWKTWDAVDCPVLVLRGAESDVLLPDTVERMKSKRNVTVIEFDGVGHAPGLMNAAQIGAVRDFLLRDTPLELVPPSV
jgi:pimeloyl-ACP methyl ester carboxylesterase